MAIFLLAVLTLGTLWYWSYGFYINDEEVCSTGRGFFIATIVFGWGIYAGFFYDSGEERRLYKEEYNIIKTDDRVFFIIPGKNKEWAVSTRDAKIVSNPDLAKIYKKSSVNFYGYTHYENYNIK